jgi:hypothetical protein
MGIFGVSFVFAPAIDSRFSYLCVAGIAFHFSFSHTSRHGLDMDTTFTAE